MATPVSGYLSPIIFDADAVVAVEGQVSRFDWRNPHIYFFVVRTNQGYSVGRWDGGALLVDTRLFADHRSMLPGTGLPSGARKPVLERYALSDDGTRLSIDIVPEAPEYLAEPFTHTLDWVSSGYAELSTFACDPDQATRFMFEPPRP